MPLQRFQGCAAEGAGPEVPTEHVVAEPGLWEQCDIYGCGAEGAGPEVPTEHVVAEPGLSEN